MNLIETGSFPIDDIVIGERLRQVDDDWVAAMAKMIEASTLQHPISLVAFADGTLHLGAGAHRLAAVKQLGWSVVPAHLYEPDTDQPERELRMLEVTENVGRRELSALDRAGHIAELEEAHKALYPHNQHGGDRRSKGSQLQVAMFAIRRDIANKVGIGERTIRAAIALWNGLDPDVRWELQGMELAHNQAQLVQLSKVEPERQPKVLALMSGDEPKARKVIDALSILDRKIDLKDPVEEQYNRLMKAWGKAGQKAQSYFLDTLAERGVIQRGKAK